MLGFRRVEELLKTAGAKRLLPVAAKLRKAIAAHDGVVGVEDEASRRIEDLRRLFEGDRSGPVAGARGAVGRQAPVARFAGRQQAGTDVADFAVDVGEGEVLGRRLEGPQRIEELAPVARHVDTQQRFGAGVVVAQAREREGDRLAGSGERGEAAVDVGNHRTVSGGAHLKRHVGRALDVDGLVARRKQLRPVGRQVARRIGGIDGFDEQVLGVGVGSGQAPGDMIGLADQDQGEAGNSRALDPALRRDDAGEIPEDRRAEVEVGVVGEDRLAGFGQRAGDDPFVRGAVAEPQQRAEPVERAVALGMVRAGDRRRGDRPIRLRRREEQAASAAGSVSATRARRASIA